MILKLTPEEETFKAEVKDFLANKLPPYISEKVLAGKPLEKDDHVDWQKILYERGWAAKNWPHEYGGTEWSSIQKHIWAEQIALAGAPEVVPFGITMVAPVIYTYGSEDQKQRFLPDILASNVWWCQGYSEPDAGSDLSSLKTTALVENDEYVVNGTKTWITFAQHADWIFCLVRTGSSTTSNSEAISFLLIPLDTPGITISPIATMDGYDEMNEVHFKNVRVPIENRIGEEGQGWAYSKLVLNRERANMAHVALSKSRLAKLKKSASETSSGSGTLMDDPYFSAKFAKTEIELSALEFSEFRVLSAASNGTAPGSESSILKLVGTELSQLIDELFVEAAGLYSQPYVDEELETNKIIPEAATNTSRRYFNNRKASLFGGSSEVQKNIICKDVLGFDQEVSGGQK